MTNNALSLYEALLATHYTLPQTLRDCYEAFREEELQRVCSSASQDEHAQLLNVLQVFLNNPGAVSFNQIFSLLDRDAYDNEPPGTVIGLPEPLLQVIERFEYADELQTLLDRESERLKRICERKELSRPQMELLGHLATEGLSDTRNFETIDEMIRYVAANSSFEILNYLQRTQALLDTRQTRQFRFPDMVAFRMEQIRNLAQEYGITFTLDDFRCFTDAEIKMIARDHKAFALLPNCKHYAVCERCQERVLDFAQRWMTGLEAAPAEYAHLPIFRRH